MYAEPMLSSAPVTLASAPRLPYKLSNTPSLAEAARAPRSAPGLTPSAARSMKNWEPHEDEILKRIERAAPRPSCDTYTSQGCHHASFATRALVCHSSAAGAVCPRVGCTLKWEGSASRQRRLRLPNTPRGCGY